LFNAKEWANSWSKVKPRFGSNSSFVIFIILASLDNAAAGVVPPLYALIARALDTSEASLGLVTSAYILLVAGSAALWGYYGDRGQRKRLLLLGTLLWSGAMIGSGLATSFTQLVLFQAITAVGVGSISSIGFSVVSDYIPAGRRGFALSLWSLSQMLGSGLGALLAGTVGALNWRLPFFIIAGAGLLFACLYLFTHEPQRGRRDPELSPLFAQGRTYDYRIKLQDVWELLRHPSNRWLLWQSFFFSLAFGSTIWIPRWAIARVQAEGYGLETATVVGNIFVILFNAGALLAIPAGYLADRWQRRSARGRANIGVLGTLGSIPFLVLLYFLPLRNVAIATEGGLPTIVWGALLAIFTNGYVFLAFVVATAGVGLLAAATPAWSAIVADVNLPEHRGTMLGISRVFRSVGSAISVGLTGFVFTWLTADFAPPNNYAVGLAIFQIIAIPAGLCYLGVRRHVASDMARVRQTLTERANEQQP
jgi:MFS transporter, Spinster family, sphingosine-1-phosphate transporter